MTVTCLDPRDQRRPTDKYTDQLLRTVTPDIRLEGKTARMTERAFGEVPDYTCSSPTGKCDGKLFRRQDWHWERHQRCRFGYGCPPDPNECDEHRRDPRRVMEGVWRLFEVVELDEVFTERMWWIVVTDP